MAEKSRIKGFDNFDAIQTASRHSISLRIVKRGAYEDFNVPFSVSEDVPGDGSARSLKEIVDSLSPELRAIYNAAIDRQLKEEQRDSENTEGGPPPTPPLNKGGIRSFARAAAIPKYTISAARFLLCPVARPLPK